MKIINSLLLVLICLTFVRCAKDSIETELNDPSLTAAIINVNKTVDTNGIISSEIVVALQDKNGNFVPVKGGWAKVDGIKMKIKQNIVNKKKSYYYSSEDIYNKIELNRLYNFEIRLSDGNVYNASITTQEVDLHELVLPAFQPKLTDMQISWKDIDTVNPIRLTLICKYENGGADSYQGYLGSVVAQKGTDTFSKDYFVDTSSQILKALVIITSTKSGTMDSRLNTGSEITSTFNVEKECDVK